MTVPTANNFTIGKRKTKYRPEIDGIRAFAVVAVIINHFNNEILPGGYLGVDIFFVISGYVITSSLAERKSKNLLHFLGSFYERRIKRLVPALVVFVLITSILITLFNPDPDAALKTGGTALLGFSNLYLLKNSTDYFAESTTLNPFTHTWSLGVEEQFYLLFPFLVWFSGFGQQKAKGALNLFLLVGVLTIVSLISFIYFYQVNQSAAYYLMPPRFWEMAVGCLIFISFHKRAKIEQRLEQVPPLLVVAAIFGVMFLPLQMAELATLLTVALSAVLIACLKKGTAAFELFTHEKVVYLGLISYSLYLWHWGILSISRWTIGVNWWTIPFQASLMLLIGILSYKFVETPMRGKSQNINGTMVYITSILTISSSLLLIKTISSKSIPIFEFANPQVKWEKWVNADGKETGGSWVLTEALVKRKQMNFTKSRPSRWCFVNQVANNDLQSCLGTEIVRDNQKGRLLLIGDSHADMYLPGLSNAFPSLDIRSYAAGWGCSYLSRTAASIVDADKQINCSEYVSNVDTFIANYLHKNDMIVLAFNWQGKKHSPGLAKAIIDLAVKVTNKGASFVLLDDVPGLGNPPLCQQTWYRPFTPSNCRISIDIVNKDQSSLDAIGLRISSLGNRAAYVKHRSSFCSKEGICSAYLDGAPIYRDLGHISEKSAITYTTDTFKRELTPLLR